MRGCQIMAFQQKAQLKAMPAELRPSTSYIIPTSGLLGKCSSAQSVRCRAAALAVPARVLGAI